MKKLIAILCAVALLFATVTVCSAAAPVNSEARADSLYELGLFKGSGNGYDLGSTPSRAQGVAMLIRLLGKDAECLAAGLEHPFKDNIPDWAAPYIAYGYHNGLAYGVDNTPGKERFDPDSLLNATSYVTLLLRSLGYSDADGDYSWNTSIPFAVSLGFITQSGAETLNSKNFTRADLVDLSYAALSCKMKGSDITLSQFLADAGVYTAAQQARWVNPNYAYGIDKQWAAEAANAVQYGVRTVSTPSGNVTAHVLQIDTSNPYVEVKQVLSDKTIHDPLPFATIVNKAKENGALAVITSNFYTSNNTPHYPVGNIMSDGEILFTSTYSTLGITSNGELRIGRPTPTAWMKPVDVENPPRHWLANAINVSPGEQPGNMSVLYTPAFGDSFRVAMAGSATTVRNGVVAAHTYVEKDDVISIPSDGYVLLLSPIFEDLYLYKTPAIGQKVELEYRLKNTDAEGFTMDGVVTMISGAPRLVQDGEIYTELEPTFSGTRFTGNYSAPRTAVGVTADNMLILVSVPSATTQQMRELMLNLGCVDAFNLDGGASTGIYYADSTYLPSQRGLITTIQIYVNTP